MRTLHSIALIALAFVIALPARAGEQLELDMARARAEACLAVAKVTGQQPCLSAECKAAEDKAQQLVAEAVKQPVVATRDRILIDGKIYTRRTDGRFWLDGQGPVAGGDPPDSGCRIINGVKVCPLQR